LADEQNPDVRFSLANERTLLAYQRTSIGLMAAGIAVVHFFGDGALVFILAMVLILTGAIAVVGGYVQYRRTDVAIREGRTVDAGPTAHFVSLALVLCLVIATIYAVTRGT
jgi:putative membrane protein